MNQPRERSKADSREDQDDRIEGELKIQKTQIAKLNGKIPHKTHIIRHMLIVGLAFSEKAKCERADILNSENMGAPRTKE